MSERTAPASPSRYLQIYLILYDLLNDDDEDVRETAAFAASIILRSERTASRTQLKLSPLAASEKLALFLATKFRGERNFPITVLRRIWFTCSASVNRGNFERNIEFGSVKALLESLRQSSSALFEEEKQNLYMDGIREVEIWSHILKTIEPPDGVLLNSLGDWVLAALRDLGYHLNNNVDFDGPLGFTSQADILTLFVQVIELAGIMLHWASHQPGQVQGSQLSGAFDPGSPLALADVHHGLNEKPPASHWIARILPELQALGEVGRRLCIHERIIRSIEEIIKKQ